MGTRLTVTGKEQTTLRGSLSVAAGAASPIDVIWQNPGLLRVTISGSESRVLSFDGATPAASDRTLSATDSDLLEMLTDDYPDAFFVSLARGRAGFRFLGGRFRADTGATKDYAGPYYTIYQKAGLVPSRKAAAQKFYLFDSATGLLSKVRYVRTDGKTTVPVEVRYSNWQTAEGEQFPGSIVRVSQGKPEITLNFSSFSIAPAAETSVFKQQ
ncbi:MAG TPA: hypothetical protein VHI52_10635 [Verrucomicrobiae bacterium]|nr:hypothetical protein [Verrucomicrobiae bacterium]